MKDQSLDDSPTRVRWRVAGLLFVISVITYIDRVNISVTARQMMPALGLTEVQMGYVFTAFVFGYALCQIPGGWLGDRWGARRVLTVAVIWWSIFTALTAIAATLPPASLTGVLGSLLLVRFLIGVGEAAALPNFNRAVANWLAPTERGLGISLAIAGIGFGSAVTPPITAWLMVNFGWQMVFYVSAVLGLAAAALWFWYVTDHPSEHPSVNMAEVRLIAGDSSSGHHDSQRGHADAETSFSWASLAKTPTVRWLVLSYSCLGYAAYFYMSWLYLYLINVRGFGELRGALFASMPFIAIAGLCPLGGWTTDRLAHRFGVNHGRQWVGMAGMLLAACSILGGAYTDTPVLAITLLSLGAGWLYFTVGAYWASTADLCRARAGTLSGIMNTGANLGGSLSPTLTPWLAEQFGWAAALGVAAGVALLGGVMWLSIKPAAGLRL